MLKLVFCEDESVNIICFLFVPGDEIHFVHLDQNRLDHVPINTVLQLAGVETVDFTYRSEIIDI